MEVKYKEKWKQKAQKNYLCLKLALKLEVSYLAWAVLGAGLWSVVNGILHDIFVLRSEYGKKYDRELLRLLMDGHVLITCGAIQAFSFTGIEKQDNSGYIMAGIASLSLLIYCAMIWKFLKSVATIPINAAILTLLIISFAAK